MGLYVQPTDDSLLLKVTTLTKPVLGMFARSHHGLFQAFAAFIAINVNAFIMVPSTY